MKTAVAATTAVGLLAGVCASTIGIASARTSRHTAAVHTVQLTAHYSHWSQSHVSVPAGTVLRFVVRNQDPIDHELIVGDDGVQARHEAGTEPRHPPRPGEISVPAGTTAGTEIVFDRPGRYVFACHIPGHFAYGMHGTIDVT